MNDQSSDTEKPSPVHKESSEAVTIDGGGVTPSVDAKAVPGYDILGELGRGGMGVVYKARQTKLDRYVALKMILNAAHTSAKRRDRFAREAQAIARLDHPNIVQIYEVSEHNGSPYFSLEYVSGGSLDQRLRKQPLVPKEAARLILALTQGMAAAHQADVIHRDLKPANVLLTEDGTPKITDFGLAKHLEEEGPTKSGTILGTPSYMAPEQASGKTKDIVPATDVYALGSILYECLTGKPPFQSATTVETILQVLHREPVPLRIVNPDIPADLDCICMKCLEKDPQSRYQTMDDLAEDLDHFIKDEPIKARSFSMIERMRRILDRTQTQDADYAFGNVFLLFALIIVTVECGIFFPLTRGGQPYPDTILAIARISQFVAMGIVFWIFRRRQLLPTTATERLMWSTWTGVLIATWLLSPIWAALNASGVHVDMLVRYVPVSLLVGSGFFVMGSHFWGKAYLFAIAFYSMALVLPFCIQVAPLVFGLVAGTNISIVGLHLRRLERSKRAEEEK